MIHTSISVIHEEHASLSAMLYSLRLMIERGMEDQPAVFFDVLRAMIFYIDEVPEKQHHTKESELLFPAIARRTDDGGELISQLESDHRQGEKAVRELQHKLLAWEILGESRRKEFEEKADLYIDFYLNHIRLEEKYLIPQALKVLTAADWKELDKAFEKNSDPMSQQQPRDPVYDRLFTKIVMHTPEPIGLGSTLRQRQFDAH
ncbi:MAG: hemerythrin domain-containing protein [Betaproteobacteria bacterium]|jgi:hemerythrin-like domain-containing protein